MNDKDECEGEIGASNCSDSANPQTDVEELKKKLKPPDSKKFDRDVEKVNATIRQKEAKFRSYPKSSRSTVEKSPSSHHDHRDRETLMVELREHKAQREKEIEMRKKIDQDLRETNSLVQKKTETCGKLQAGLKYKTESKVEEAIRRLEHQMRVQQLKLREEKRIVTEIDTLRRSKKSIHDFDALKNEIAQLRERQHIMRSKRDACSRTITGLKSKEEEIKHALDEQRNKADEARNQQKEYATEKNALKKEIDELYDKKRALVAAFNKEKDEYHNILRDIKVQERQIKREFEITTRSEERPAYQSKQSAQSRDMNEQSIAVANHEKMVALCDTLLNYVEKINIDMCTKMDYGDSSTFHEPREEVQGAAASFSGGTFLKKKNDSDLEEMYGGSTKKQSRRSSKKGRRSTQKENIPKKLVLHPLVLEQFLSLYITPPSTASDIPKTLELLHEKKAVLCAVLANPDTMFRDSKSPAEPSTEDFPSLPSQNSVEPLTISSTDECTVRSDETPMATGLKQENVVANGVEQEMESPESPNDVLENKDENVADEIKEELKCQSTSLCNKDSSILEPSTISSTDECTVSSDETQMATGLKQENVVANGVEQEMESPNDVLENKDENVADEIERELKCQSTSLSNNNSSILNDETQLTTELKQQNVVTNNVVEQDRDKEMHSPDEDLDNKAERLKAKCKNELQSQLNGNQDSVADNLVPNESQKVKKPFKEPNLDNGFEDVSLQHKMNDMESEDDIENSSETILSENGINDQDVSSNENATPIIKKNIEASINQANIEYMVNEFRNCDSTDENPKLCSTEVLPQQMNDQDSERAIDCPA